MKKVTILISILTLISHFATADTYVVKSGDTLSSIAYSHCSSTSQLRKLNSIALWEKLDIGREIILPENSCQDRADILFLAPNNTNKKSYISDALTKATTPFNAYKYLGHKYVWGAVGPNVFDCSGFTSYLFKKEGIILPRTAAQQFQSGARVARDELKQGDLVFFDTEKRMTGKVNHVGIYIGNNKFIHASSAQRKVIITKLGGFYSQRYMGARRYTA